MLKAVSPHAAHTAPACIDVAPPNLPLNDNAWHNREGVQLTAEDEPRDCLVQRARVGERRVAQVEQ